jgi:hypothetical protein
MRRARRSNVAWRERGAAAVELAIIMPLLLLVIAGIVDFGRYFMTEIQLTNAVREGARVAVIGETPANVILRTTTAAPVVPGLVVTVPQVCASGGGGDAKVRATGDFDWILLKPAMSMFGASGALPQANAEAVMRCGG